MVGDLIDTYQPDAIALEDFASKGSRRCGRVQRLIRDVQKLAAKRKVRARSISRSEIKTAFSEDGAVTKHQIATAIARRFPELAPRLPPVRKPWMPEDYRMPIFDAGAMGVAFFVLKK